MKLTLIDKYPSRKSNKTISVYTVHSTPEELETYLKYQQDISTDVSWADGNGQPLFFTSNKQEFTTLTRRKSNTGKPDFYWAS